MQIFITLSYFFYLQPHYEECELCPKKCPNDGCESKMLKKEFPEHFIDKCMYHSVKCEFYEAGCLEKVTLLKPLRVFVVGTIINEVLRCNMTL